MRGIGIFLVLAALTLPSSAAPLLEPTRAVLEADVAFESIPTGPDGAHAVYALASITPSAGAPNGWSVVLSRMPTRHAAIWEQTVPVEVGPLKSLQKYYFFAKACPSGAAETDARCGPWQVQEGGRGFDVPALSGGGIKSVTSSDVTAATITARAAPDHDGYLERWHASIKEAGATNLANRGTAYPHAVDAWTIGGLLPNRVYDISQNLEYAHDQQAAGASQRFYTRPSKPEATEPWVNPSSAAAQIFFLNSEDPALANPAGTIFEARFRESGQQAEIVAATVSRSGLAAEILTIIAQPLRPGATYAVTLKALNVGRAQGWQDSAAIDLGTFRTTVPDTMPPAVSIAGPIDGAVLSGSTVVWAAASDNVGIAGVQFKLDGRNLGEEDTEFPFSISWNTALASNGAHSLAAVARDTSGNTAVSAAATVVVDNAAPAISGVAVVRTATNSATIAWNTAEPADSQVEYGPSVAYGNMTALNAAFSTSRGIDVWGLSPRTLYHYRVRSRDRAGNLAVSADATFTTAAEPPPLPPPSNLSTEARAFKVELRWSAPDDRRLAGYELSVSTASDFSAPSLYRDHPIGLKERFVVQGLQPLTRYFLRLRAVGDGIKSVAAATSAQTLPSSEAGYKLVSPTDSRTEIVGPSDAKVVIEPGTFESAVTVSIEEIAGMAAAAGMIRRGPVYELGPGAIPLRVPALVSLPAADGFPQPGLFRLDEESGRWTAVSGAAFYGDRVEASVDQLGIYAAMVDPSAYASNAIRQAYSFPNPSASPTLRAILEGSADSVDVRIYNAGGEQVTSVALGQAAPQPDGTWIAERRWDASGVPSGIYTCVFHAKSPKGEGRMRKKIAIVK